MGLRAVAVTPQNPDAPNLSASNIAGARKALAKALGGLANGRILFLGDSTTVGQGATNAGAFAGMKNYSYVAKLAALLNSAGITSTLHSLFGDFGYNLSAPTYDTRLAIGTWAQGGLNCLGGTTWQAAAAAGNLAFTPTSNTDTCEIYYLTGASTGSFNANVNGGTNTLISTIAANGVGKTTITGTLGANAYNCAWASGGTVFICGFVAYDSTQKQVQVINSGRGSAQASTIVSAWPAASNHFTALAPDFTFIELGINEWVNATSAATYTTNMQTLITAALAVGGCALIAPVYSNPGSYASASQQAITAAALTLAQNNGIAFLDMNARFGGYTAGNALGFYNSDGIHLQAAGYADEARFLYSALEVQ